MDAEPNRLLKASHAWCVCDIRHTGTPLQMWPLHGPGPPQTPQCLFRWKGIKHGPSDDPISKQRISPGYPISCSWKAPCAFFRDRRLPWNLLKAFVKRHSMFDYFVPPTTTPLTCSCQQTENSLSSGERGLLSDTGVDPAAPEGDKLGPSSLITRETSIGLWFCISSIQWRGETSEGGGMGGGGGSERSTAEVQHTNGVFGAERAAVEAAGTFLRDGPQMPSHREKGRDQRRPGCLCKPAEIMRGVSDTLTAINVLLWLLRSPLSSHRCTELLQGKQSGRC